MSNDPTQPTETPQPQPRMTIPEAIKLLEDTGAHSLDIQFAFWQRGSKDEPVQVSFIVYGPDFKAHISNLGVRQAVEMFLNYKDADPVAEGAAAAEEAATIAEAQPPEPVEPPDAPELVPGNPGDEEPF